jgi:hypothetical protein
MVESLRTFSTEVTRVAKEVGTEGKLGGRATVLGVGGTWKVSCVRRLRLGEATPDWSAPCRTSPTRSTPWQRT